MSKRGKLFYTFTAKRIPNVTDDCTAGHYICVNHFALRSVRGVVN